MIRKNTRQLLRTIYVFACGYCGITEEEMGAELAIDHFQPSSQGGSDDVENLVYCCNSCNSFKGDRWDAANPLVLHPLNDDMKLHIVEQADGTLMPLTDRGRRHIDTLNLNRRPLVRKRRNYAFRDSDSQNQQMVLDRLTALRESVADLQTKFEAFEHKRRKR